VDTTPGHMPLLTAWFATASGALGARSPVEGAYPSKAHEWQDLESNNAEDRPWSHRQWFNSGRRHPRPRVTSLETQAQELLVHSPFFAKLGRCVPRRPEGHNGARA